MASAASAMAWVLVLRICRAQARESLPEQLAVYVAKEKENDSIVLAAGSARFGFSLNCKWLKHAAKICFVTNSTPWNRSTSGRFVQSCKFPTPLGESLPVPTRGPSQKTLVIAHHCE